MNEKLMKMLGRQAVLVAALQKNGKLSDDENAELEDLNKKIQGISDLDSVEIGKTDLETMTVKEFRAFAQKEHEEASADMNAERLALLKRNVASVRRQNKTKDDDIVAVEILAKRDGTSDAQIAALQKQIEDLTALIKGKNFDGRGNTGLVDNDGDGEGDGEGEGGNEGEGAGDGSAAKGEDMPASTAVAIEALGAIIERYSKIKGMIEEGTEFSEEDLVKMWPGWELREAVENATAVLAKLEELQGLIESVHPALEKIAKAKDDETPDGDGDGDGEGDEGDGGEGDGTPTEKGVGGGSNWLSGEDMSAELDSKAQFGVCKGSKI